MMRADAKYNQALTKGLIAVLEIELTHAYKNQNAEECVTLTKELMTYVYKEVDNLANNYNTLHLDNKVLNNIASELANSYSLYRGTLSKELSKIK